jgi:hypothetical protein
MPRHPSPALVISIIALIVALGGTGYAALKLPKNSVGSKQIKKNAVGASKVKNGSLLSEDFQAGQLPAGAQGPIGPIGPNGDKGDKGDQGDAGAPGTARAFAVIAPDGTVNNVTTSKGIVDANVTHNGTGEYCISGLSFKPTAAVVSGDNTQGVNDTLASVQVASSTGLPLTCPGAAQLRVRTYGIAAVGLADRRFNIWVEG